MCRAHPFLHWLFVAVTLFFAGCADSTLPPRGEEEQPAAISPAGVRPSDALTMPWYNVVVPRCDPDLDLSFCEEEDCMNSAVEQQPEDEFSAIVSCGGPGDPGSPGGPGSGGDGNPTVPPCPDYGCTEPEPEVTLATDMMRDTIPPSDCAAPTNTHWQQIYCRSSIDSEQASKTRQALDRIAARGAECAVLAQKGREMLAAGAIRFYSWTKGDEAAYGHPNTDIQIGAQIVGRYDPSQPDQDFEHILVHELDHMFRRDHIEGQTWHTPNTALCG
jgi:hypothetical protein